MNTERIIQLTEDGSHTLFVPALNEHYHSVNGAIRESIHVFINAGLREVRKDEIRILEIGFGTGLNALLSLQYAHDFPQKSITYHTIERFPLGREITDCLNYGQAIAPEGEEWFREIHAAEWERPVEIIANFTLVKIQGDSNRCPFPPDIDLIYFDAFAPDKQPEMWQPAIFGKLFGIAAPEALIVTYCAKGEVRRRMQNAGFLPERLPGPPGKRHMLRGKKIPLFKKAAAFY
ncbi:MAG: tRNA (5-methylaminomethyl-2-thiouridine)(34)-methyltransferase MnmD [Tannerellaceae bacterium]|jgi:tRNA U34 5-methylaminomethyl-2-thiouridine-forming methyltransferase MnmC|nr:tRNA (5-methylaminomethyl-2-thiouridine)(34)-methyltransferase MnmD [Tannerellaceae bacterium]